MFKDKNCKVWGSSKVYVGDVVLAGDVVCECICEHHKIEHFQ